ncbi:CG12994 [Drosophila busckii]|uniref:CG12994 n=1 Tax=Drosophila busckii TaxID=30019 RepID=A0A0M4EWN6_DROBS|nr:CG12994 [Drosophila busckii]
MEGLIKSNLTVQGVGSPVPAISRGEQAGPRSSSSCDRNASVVAHLAAEADNATSKVHRLEGLGEEGYSSKPTFNPFQKSRKLLRSPKKAQSAATPMQVLPTRDVVETPTEVGRVTKIRALSKMLEGRRSIHQPMRDLIDGILGLYTTIDEEMASAVAPTPNVCEGKRTRGERDELASPPPGAKKARGQSGQKPQDNTEIVGDQPPVKKAIPEEKWKKVVKKKPRNKSSKPDAIVVRADQNTSYADILRSVKAEPKLKELAQHVRGIRKTAKGELLFELSKTADPSTKIISEAVQEFLGANAEVRALTETSLVEIKDIDEVTTEEELLEAMITQFVFILNLIAFDYFFCASAGRSYVGINEEIMWVSIGMGVTIALLITIALCYIAREKCQKRQREYYVTA